MISLLCFLTSFFLLVCFTFHPGRLRGCRGKCNAKLRAKVMRGGASRPHPSPLPRCTQFRNAFSLYLDPLHGFFSLKGGFCVRSRGGWSKHPSGVVAVEISLVKLSARISVQSADVLVTLSVHHRYTSGYPCRCSTTLASTDIQADIRADIITTFASTDIREDIGVIRMIRHGHPYFYGYPSGYPRGQFDQG